MVDHETFFLEDGVMTEGLGELRRDWPDDAHRCERGDLHGPLHRLGNFNLNERNTNDTFALAFRAIGSDGSSLIGHEVTHFALNALGQVTVEFDRMSLDCG